MGGQATYGSFPHALDVFYTLLLLKPGPVKHNTEENESNIMCDGFVCGLCGEVEQGDFFYIIIRIKINNDNVVSTEGCGLRPYRYYGLRLWLTSSLVTYSLPSHNGEKLICFKAHHFMVSL